MSTTCNLVSDSAGFTERLGQRIAALTSPGTIIWLHGSLGAGKTCFCRGFIHHFDATTKVKSPTYSLLEAYTLDDLAIYHFDFYRVQAPEELSFIGADDCFNKRSICLIEWPEQALSILPPPQIEVSLRYSELEDQRSVQIQTQDMALLEQIQKELPDVN